MKFLTNDGIVLTARNPAHLVRQMRQRSYDAKSYRSEAEFMREVAYRVRQQKRTATISTRTHNAFVRGLIRAGFLTEVNK